MVDDLSDFLDNALESEKSVLVKRLSANDTGATNAHQAGIYIPKPIAFSLCPSLKREGGNPDHEYSCDVVSHGVNRINRLVWYRKGSRNECRITKWAEEKKQNSVLKPPLTGAIAILAFSVNASSGIGHCSVWFCQSPVEEDLVEARCGTIDPGVFWFKHRDQVGETLPTRLRRDPCVLTVADFPEKWLLEFPEASEIIAKTIEVMPVSKKSADDRLIDRRYCEFTIFKSIEHVHVMPAIQKLFTSVDAFISLANSVTNRRKARSGRSFELHLKAIFDEASLHYSHGAHTEGKKTPDFVFPSVSKYHDKSFPSSKLRMLGVKTTCKDRWRQIISEADRIPIKHLITLQEGVSVPQFEEMKTAGIRLVVPTRLHAKYPQAVRPELLSLESFIAEVQSA